MARPSPIIVPLERQIEGAGQTQAGQAIGQLLGQLLGRGIQQKRETAEQQAFKTAFPGLFPKEETPVTPEATTGLLPAESISQPEQRVPENVQALTRLLSQSPQGRQLGQQFATQQAAQRLKPVTPPKPGDPFLSADLVAELNLPVGTEITSSQAKDIGAKLTPEVSEKLKTVEVQSSKILPGGLAQVVFKDGTSAVVKSTDADAALVRNAEVRGAELQGLRGGEREAATKAIKASTKAFETIPSIKKNIANLEEGISLIDQGAQTGVIAKRFPSIKRASLELENLQGQLGLDVVGATTFGALSESELAFAKDTALPIGLEGPALKDWLTRKRKAQMKVLDNLTETAIFLGVPGNTISGFLNKKRAQQQTQPTGEIQFLGFE